MSPLLTGARRGQAPLCWSRVLVPRPGLLACGLFAVPEDRREQNRNDLPVTGTRPESSPFPAEARERLVRASDALVSPYCDFRGELENTSVDSAGREQTPFTALSSHGARVWLSERTRAWAAPCVLRIPGSWLVIWGGRLSCG